MSDYQSLIERVEGLPAVRLSELERRVFKAWEGSDEDYGFGFRAISRLSGVEQGKIRRAVRALARKGVVKFTRALWTDEGEPAGAGYTLTEFGASFLRALQSQEEGNA